ncbi:PREDICTED: golgin subfamily B member 1-like isoform X2 [Thamnophis sirtalis]|uniref:Golgin subfamily B member 1-like isoform X2 n=1 Tax=Thamnophis sirtalis TaxID=35019 RepID=A0A6I9Y220_9SAUR|nr:PREDICTED: golgin subfamily B member 1-like isoform X2 [Thamnophis sirtalis]
MWRWGSGDDSVAKSEVHGSSQVASMSVGDLTEQLAQTKQLVAQLKELVKEKDDDLQKKDKQLKEEKEASDSKLSKLKLQNKAKVASLTSQLEELKKQVPGNAAQDGKSGQKKSDQDSAAANRGKILVLRKKVEELETLNAQKNEELQQKIAELDAAHQRGAELDAMLAEKQKKLTEKEAYIIDLQLACGSTNDAKEMLIHNNELKQISTKEASLQSMQILVQNLTRKVGDSEERCSLLQEQIASLKSFQTKEKEHFQEREAMYTQNIRMFQNIIQEKEKELMRLAQKHEQELFKVAAKSDASADLEQLLKALKQKLHEKEEVMLGRTQVIVMLQQELDGKDQQLKEMNEQLNRLESEKDNLQSKLDAEKHIMRAQLRDMMEKHENEMRKAREKYNADHQEIQETHETELQEKDQTLLQLQKKIDELISGNESNLEQAVDLDAIIKQKLEHLEVQVKLKTEEASKSEAKFLKMKAWSKSRIRQLEDELKNVTPMNSSITALQDQISELKNEKEELQSTLHTYLEYKTQNEELLAKLEIYEEQQRKLQADLEQVTKRAASQASESGSADELQSPLLEWQEAVSESEDMHPEIREEKTAMALRMAQIEEEREGLIEDDWFFPGCSDPAIVSGQQELEEELATGQGIGRMPLERKKTTQSSRKLQEDYGFDGKQCYEDLNITLDSTDSTEGENMGGWWPEYTSPSTGLRTVVEELELERNNLQEQILFLEERCGNLEDKLQLQGRMEALQNENDRLRSQLAQLRNQQTRDTEKHQLVLSNLNEQLKGLNERNSLFETLLAEKEQKLSSAVERLEQIEDIRKSLQEKELLNKELSERLLQNEQKLEDVLKKCNSYGVECSEQKIVINELTEKVSVFKEKTAKQDADMQLIQQDLEQTNEELDRLNTSHLEERSQLIQDLQRREREIDNLREMLIEKDKEISDLSLNMSEYSEQIRCKEDEIREMERTLSKAEKEVQLLKDVQTTDMKDASIKFSELNEKLRTIESELAIVKVENEAKTKENLDLTKQVKEASKSIKELHSEMKNRDIAYSNKLLECESQIKLLKEQISKSTEKVQETEIKCKEEIEQLRIQLDEHISAKEKLNNLLQEKENKEQSFVNELKSVKELYNQLTVESAKKDEELSTVSRQLAEHTEHLEIAKKSVQEKTEVIISLKDKLKVIEQQNEEEKLKFLGELDNKAMEWKKIKDELQAKHEIINKLEMEKQASILSSKQLVLAVEQKEKDLASQIKVTEDLRNEKHVMEKEKQQLINENESLSKLLDVKECELLKGAQCIEKMESKITGSDKEHEQLISEINQDRKKLRNKVKELSIFVKEKEDLITEKEKKCEMLDEQLSEKTELTKQLHQEILSLNTHLKVAKDRELEKEEMLRKGESEYSKMVQQLSCEEEKILSLQKHVQDLEMDLNEKSKSLEEKDRQYENLLKQIKEKQADMVALERELEKLQGIGQQLSHQVEEKNAALLSQGLELQELHRQIVKKTEEYAALSDKLALLAKEVDILKCEKENAFALCSTKSGECETLQHQLLKHQSETVSIKHEAHILKLENEKFKRNIETIHSALVKKCGGIALLNEQNDYNILAFVDYIDSLLTEIETLKSNFYAKESLLSQREALIQQIKENKDLEEKQYLQTISNLQNKVQTLDCESDKFKLEIQEKNENLQKQAQDLKLFKDKSEESELLRFQLSENMKIISDLHCQLNNMTEKIEEFNKLITEKDTLLKQKEEEYVNLQAHNTETSCVQQKTIESFMSEAAQLKASILEKELLINNISSLNNTLNAELQEKKNEYETLKKQATNVEELNLSLKKEVLVQEKLINDISQILSEKQGSALDNANLVKQVREELKINEEKNQLISQLHDQINKLTQQIQKLQYEGQEKDNAFLSLQDKFAARCEQRSELSAVLSEKEQLIDSLHNSLKEKDVDVQLAESNVQALNNEVELLREELEKSAVSLKKLLEEKGESIATSHKKINSLSIELESAKLEHRKALEQGDQWKQKCEQREMDLQVVQEKHTEQIKHIEYLNSELNIISSKTTQECHNYILSIEKLQQQVDSLTNDKAILQDNFIKLSEENKELVKCQNQLQQKSSEVEELHKKIEISQNESQIHIHAISTQLEKEREQLLMQVSVKNQELSELKLKIEKLEQNLLGLENRRVVELDRATQQIKISLEEVSSLKDNMKSKDTEIQSLQEEHEIINKQLFKCLFSLLSSRHFSNNDNEAGQQPTETNAVLEKIFILIQNICSKEAEAIELQQTFLEKEKEISHLNDQLKNMQSLWEENMIEQKNEFQNIRDAQQSEIELLSNRLSTAEEALGKELSVREENEFALTEMKKQNIFFQGKIEKLEEELQDNCKTLNNKCEKVEKLLEDLECKNQMIENLSSETTQQKDLIATLGQQLKEKDCSVTQLMETMSKEMVTFSEEKNELALKLQQLQGMQNSMAEEASVLLQQIEEYKKNLELNQIVLTNKEATIKDLLNEKEQINAAFEKLSQEKETLKKKLQAALIIRKDLTQKIKKFEKSDQEYSEREYNKTQHLLEQIDELTQQSKNLDFQLNNLNEQVLEKDTRIDDMNKMLSSKTTSLEMLQKEVIRLKEAIAEQKSISDQNLICLNEKDSLLVEMQSLLTEKEKTYAEKYSQLFLTIENLKIEALKREETCKEMNRSEAGVNTEELFPSEINQLEKEKELLHKKMQVLLAARKESTKTIQKQKEEYAKLLANFDELTKSFVCIKEDYKALQIINQRKCEGFESTMSPLHSVYEDLENATTLHDGESAKQKTLESEEMEKKSPVMVEKPESLSKVAIKEDENYHSLMKEKETFEKELRQKSHELDRKEHEIMKLKFSVEQLEQQYKQDNDSMVNQRGDLRQQLETYKDELTDVSVIIEKINETAVSHKIGDGNDLEQIEKLKLAVQQANIQISEKNKEIKKLSDYLNDFTGKIDHGKETMKEICEVQQNLLKNQEEAKHFKLVFEDLRQKIEEFTSNTEKSNEQLFSMKAELRDVLEENQKLLIELNVLREKGLPVSNVNENMAHEKSSKNSETAWLHFDHVQQNSVQNTDIPNPLVDVSYVEKDSLDFTCTTGMTSERLNSQDHPPLEIAMGQNVNVENCQLQQQKCEEKIRDHLQRKLQAALISRKEARKENKVLKDQIEALMSENKELVNKTDALELLVSELSRDQQDFNEILCKKEVLATENASLLNENENLTAACESLKSTMETIAQEKEAFSFQLNSLKDSQTVELTGWKAKHNELKEEYESLLQAYENVSSKIAEMRQVIDVTRKEKQEALHKISLKESDKQELQKLLQEARDENAIVKDQLEQLVESKSKEMTELYTKAEEQASKHELSLEEHKKMIDESALQNNKLIEENEHLKEVCETLKLDLEKNQEENVSLWEDFNLIKSALKNLQIQLGLRIFDVSSEMSERDSLSKYIHLLTEEILGEKKESMHILKQENKIISERLKDDQDTDNLFKLENYSKSFNQEIVSLGEKIKILEDDKSLLQEELENVQEISYKVKNEKEYLETELLNHIKKLDQMTDRLNSKELQINLLTQQLEDIESEKSSTIREKEEQQQVIRIFEEKIKSAQRDTNGTKNKTKELQELLKEKQQEINQLQTDSIKYQLIILDLEKSLKWSQTRNEKTEKDLSNVEEKLTKSNEELQSLAEKFSSQKTLLDEAKAEIEKLAIENLNSKKELKKKENQILVQKRQYEHGLQQLKTTCPEEWSNLEEKFHILQQEKEKILGEHHMQREADIRDSQNKNLQNELNDDLARLAAFSYSLPRDMNRVIENKQQAGTSDRLITSLQEETEVKMSQIQESELSEETKSVMQASVDSHNFNELSQIKAENITLWNKLQMLTTALASKEDALHALIKENRSLNHLIKNNTVEKEMEALKKNLTRKEQETQQLLLEKREIRAELEKQLAISDQMKKMLNKKDTEISVLISSKDTDTSGYLTQIQTLHPQQISEYEQQIKCLQIAKEQSDETCKKMQYIFKNVQKKASQDRAEIASEIDTLKKAMSSLQNDRDSLLSKHKYLECEYRDALSEKERLITDNANETRTLKQEIRKLLNQIDDLHSENAMLTAQLLKYREDLNQVLSLKDNQLKELLTEKLDYIKSLHQEKFELLKKMKELQQSMKVQEEIIESLKMENGKLTSKVCDLEILIASINKMHLEGNRLEQKKEPHIDSGPEENLERLPALQELVVKEKIDRNSDARLLDNEAIGLPQRLLEIQLQNKELRSELESFGKTMTALQRDRERLMDDFKVFQSKSNSELAYEKNQVDKYEAELKDFKSNILGVIEKYAFLSQTLLKTEGNFTLHQLTDEIENLCKRLKTQNLEISRLSSECETYVQQMNAFSKAMASLQDDRDRHLQELSKLRVAHEAKQGTNPVSIPYDCNSEISSLKHNVKSLQVDRDRLAKEGTNSATTDILKLKAKVDELERDLNQTKAFQEEAEKERASYQNEVVALRKENHLLLTESQALQASLLEKEKQVAELKKVHHEVIQRAVPPGSVKGLESVTLAGNVDVSDQVKHLLAERTHLQNELQRCFQELHQRELKFQQINSKVMQSVQENAVLSAQLKMVSQTLQDNQLRYNDLQNRHLQLERDYQLQVASVQNNTQNDLPTEVPPGAPQERAAITVEIDNMELSQLKKRLIDLEGHHNSEQQTIIRLTERLSEERNRRKVAEEALGLSEEQIKRLEMTTYRSSPRDYAVQMESDEEREALVINPNEHIVVQKVKGGALSIRRWIRGRSIFCSKLLTSRTKSRYLFLSYLVMLHLLVVLCLSGVL